MNQLNAGEPEFLAKNGRVTDSLGETMSVCQANRFLGKIAIVGMAFRFPGDLSSEESLWSALKGGQDLVTKVPSDRWAVDELQHDRRSEPGRSITFSAGVLSRIDEFDAGFFGISPREAAWLDPQQRLLLELAWEAMENAGIVPSSMAGTNCAVYVGISSLDYGTRGLDDLASMTSHSMTGNTLSIAANRISYVFDLRGPSLALDTACSSSLVALHHACNSILTGEASAALVGGVNLLLHPYPFVGFTKASMLCADGRCKTFDASADGYVRAEGGAVLLLKPLEKAIADGDEIHAVILASGVNADGARKTGITIPSKEGQAELMRSVLEKSGLSALDIDYIEAHGTGTAVGDPIETAAIGAVYGVGRANPLSIGSVKANLGHMESAAGMAGLVKAVLVLKNRALPPALHLTRPNPHIDFKGLNLELVTEYKELAKEQNKPLVVGVNSFGFGGANAHVLLQEFTPKKPQISAPKEIHTPPLFLSARTDAALRAMAGQYADFLRDKTVRDYYDIAHAAAYRRERMEKRLVLLPSTPEAAVDSLRRYAQGEMPEQIIFEDSLPEPGGVAFVYSGNGAQWVGMGCSLLVESPRFAKIIADLDAAMLSAAGFSLLEELQAAPDQSRLDDTAVAQPLLFAIQVAVTILLKEQGVEPTAVAGHSVGEIAAAWAAGALELEQAIRVICARSQAQGLTRGMGRMAVVGLSVDDAEKLIAELSSEPDVEVAGINSPSNVTLSGSLESLLRIQGLLEPKGVFFRLLDLDYAFHSRQMDFIESNLTERLEGLTPSPSGKTVFVSTVTGDVLDGTLLDAAYWWRNIRQPVRFAAAITKLAELGCRVFIEIGPHAILQRYIGECLVAAGIQGRVIPTLRRSDDGVQRVVEAALRAHLLASHPELQVYFPYPAQRVRLPNYPWQRERHWHPRTSEGLLSIERRRVHPLLGWRLHDHEAAWENTLDPICLPWLADHKVDNDIVFPGAAYAEMALAAAHEWMGGQHLIVEELDIVSPLVFDGERGRTLRLIINPRDGGLQIKSRQRLSNDDWTLHATGRLLESTNRIPMPRISRPTEPTKEIDQETHYRLAAMLGLDYGAVFQGLRKALVGSDTLEAELEITPSLRLDGYFLHPAVLDVCFQSLIDFFAEEISSGQGAALLPVKIGRLDFCGTGNATHFRARLRRRGARSVLADFELLDAKDNLIASATGCRFRVAHFKRNAQNQISSWCILPWLTPHPAEGLVTEIPPIAELINQARARLCTIDAERQTWFSETLPLIEALTLSFAYEAFQQIARETPNDWWHRFNSPYARWLASLLKQEGLLIDEGNHSTLVERASLPAADELWQTLLRDSPLCWPRLAMIGRVGRQLPALLSGEIDGRELWNELQQSPTAEVLYNSDPAYRGTHLAVEGILQYLALHWPTSRRLRVLEIAAGPSELPKALIEALPEDRLDYILALPTEAMQARQQSEYQEQVNIVVATYDAASGTLSTEHPIPDVFDVVIFHHSLHRVASPSAALTQARCRLAAGGLLLLAEGYPDWNVNFIEGINPSWWHESDAPSPLLTPETWQQALIDAGYEECELFLEPAANGLAEGAYLLLARRPAKDVAAQPAPEPASWALIVDPNSAPLADHLRVRLESFDQQVTVTDYMEASCDFDHVVFMLGWGGLPDATTGTLSRLLKDVQMLVSRSGKAPRLWIITSGGALASDLPSTTGANPTQSAIWGFGRVVMNECPQLSCTLIDLACDPSAKDTPVRLENELLRPDGASEIVLCAKARHCLVLQEETKRSQLPSAEEARFRLDFDVPGQLRNLVWRPTSEYPLRDDEIEVRTQAVGLNFRDVMYLMGLLPDEAVEDGFAGASLGLEFSGVVTRVGARVQDLLPGDAVMGFGSSCFASHVVTRADAVVRKPQSWSFEAAATVPTVFFTVYYALKHLANLQVGERVLIHGAAGGVGIAAIQLAKYLGAEVFATVGSAEKRDFVHLLGADHVFSSRSLSFADDILAATNGEGVDVVLNSLAGEAMRRSIDVLKPFGRFLELGKRDFFENTPIGLRPFKNNISYFGIDADQLLTARPKLAAQVLRQVMALFREEALVPLPYREFAADRIIDAFRTMQQARHIGKIVVSLTNARPKVEQAVQAPPMIRFDNDSTWLVTGGLSGFGLESARWLVSRGVRHLVLVGRRGVDTPGAKEMIASFAAQGVNVVAQACDIRDTHAVGSLIECIKKTMPPLKGVLHAAATFDDRLLINLDAASMETVLDTKLRGAWLLHEHTLDIPLDYFVLYSSITTAIGNPGQANYVAANAGLEGLAHMRRQMGLPATCIAWGPIGDAGYLVRSEEVKNSLEQRLGTSSIPAAIALAQLDRALISPSGLFMFANFDWSTLARLLPSATVTRFAILNRHRNEQAQVDNSLDIRALIAGKTPEEIAGIVRNLVIEEVAQILGISADRIESGRSLNDLGMDSLMAVELALGLERRFGIRLSAMMLNDASTVDKLVTRLIEKLTGSGEEAEESESVALIAEVAQQHGESIDAATVEAVAEDVSRLTKTGTRLIS